MVLLETKLKLTGLNQGHVEAEQIKRTGKVCLYKRTDEIFEVFIPNIQQAGSVFGKHYPERESYPSNEDFGKTAWSFKTIGSAEKRFEQVCKIYNN